MRTYLSLLLLTFLLPSIAMAQTQRLDMDDQVQKMAEEKEARDNRNPYDIPPYNVGDITAFGEIKTYIVGEQDSLHDIARNYALGFVELRAANQGVDAWAPVPGQSIILPSFHLVPRAPQNGIIINLAEMRLYYFAQPQTMPITFPIGIGREGLETPLGQTSIVRKKDGPSWSPTPRMREENPALPKTIGPGPANPLGTHALYLGWPTFLIHGTNKPSGIGRRVSSGCIRMLPEHITQMFAKVPVGTAVTVVDQPIKAAMVNNDLYLEVNPYGEDLGDVELLGRYENAPLPAEAPLPEGLKHVIQTAIGDKTVDVDWNAVRLVYNEKKAFPIVVGKEQGVETPETTIQPNVADDVQATESTPVPSTVNKPAPKDPNGLNR